MKILFIAARVLLGLMFTVLGINGFVPFLPVPAVLPHDAVAFMVVMASSHFAYFVFGVQVVCGLMLLSNQYVPLALVVLAAVLANILAFHITMWPATLIPMPIVALVLWFLTAWPLRKHFSALFVRSVPEEPTAT